MANSSGKSRNSKSNGRRVGMILAAFIACALVAPAAHAAVPADFAKKMTLTPSTSALAKIGESTFVNFPVLVRLPAEASALLQSANGTDLFFTDENDASLPFEVDTYNPAGETLVWVKVPSLSSATELTAYFGGAANADNDPTAVWTNYAGVWHMNEASGTVADATGNGLGASSAKSTAVSIAQATGAVGTARQTATSDVKDYLTIPNYDSLGLGGNFTFSCFYDATARKGYDRLVSRKEKHDAGNGWEVEMANSSGKLSARGASATSISGSFSDLVSSGWMRFAFVYSGSTLTAFLNGSQIGTGAITAATDNGKPLSIGCDSDGSEAYFVGYVDEARLRKGAASAAEVSLEYATMSDAAFFDAGAIATVDATEQKFATPTAVRNANGSYTITVVLSKNNGGVGVIYDGGAVPVTNIIATAATPDTYTDTPANLSGDTTYAFSAYGKNANGTEVVKAGGVFYNGDLSVTTISNANERGLAPGVFRISRVDSAHDIAVTYTVGGTAIRDQSYVALSGTATIPAGSTYVDVTVTPINDPTVTDDVTVSISLAAGLYGISASAGAATMTIANLVAPSGFNTWISTSNSLASIDCNWSAGVAPTSADNVLFDGRFSTKNCEWDAPATATVASWTQTNDYSGTVTLKTVYPGKGDFQCLTIDGDMTIDSGTITHPLSLNSTSTTWPTGADIREQEVYRLCLDVGGTLTIGANGKIDVKDKGHYQIKPSRDCYGAHAVGYSSLGGAAAYGNPKEPIDVGMGCIGNQWAWVPYPGSGAIRITAGNVIVNGKICADAGSSSYEGHRRFTAAAGSIWIDADSITGPGSITAVAVQPPDGSCGNNGRGSGGSIALWTKTPVALGSPFVSAGAAVSGFNAPGTIFLHDQNMDKGVLVIDGMRSDNPLDYRTCVNVTTDGDWTFDEVRLQSYGTLSVPVGTTLTLPGGWASITSTNAVSASNHGVLRYEGGTIVAGTAADVVLSGRWMLTPWSNLTFNANVTIKDGAAIGVPPMPSIKDSDANADVSARKLPTFVSSHITIDGNLTVETNGQLRAVSCGFVKKDHNKPSQHLGVLGYGTHGGRHHAKGKGDYLCPTNFYYKGYDSVFSPRLPGCSGWYGNGSSASGGALSLVVTGHLALDGSANASGSPATGRADQNNAGGAGGSIDITAGTISGSGTINANGGSISSTQGGGGRIAIKLTASGADFSHFAVSNVFASGRTYGNTANEKTTSSAGTVYLQTAAEGDKCGTVYIAMSAGNRLAGNTNTTEMASLGYGGDAVADYKKVKYVVRDYGRAAVNADMKADSIEIVDANSSLDLEGHTLTVKSAKVNGVKLSPGTYDAGSDFAIGEGTLADYLVDTAEGAGGELIVKGGGFQFILR